MSFVASRGVDWNARRRIERVRNGTPTRLIAFAREPFDFRIPAPERKKERGRKREGGK